MKAFFSGSDMKTADRYAIQTTGIPSAVLMDSAAASAGAYVRRFLGENFGAKILILCGKNNNGGDGFCLARLLNDYKVTVAPCYPQGASLSEDAALYASIAKQMAIPFLSIYEQPVQTLTALFSQFDVIIDAIYGTGFAGKVRDEAISHIIKAANQSQTPILSIDVPSGVDSVTGAVEGPAIFAKQTITFAALKTGLLLYPAYEHCGEMIVANIGMPSAALAAIVPDGFLIEESDMFAALPKRFATSHKTSYGKAMCLGGSRRMKGSILMSARAAISCGCGLVKLLSLESVCDLAMLSAPELLTCPLSTNEGGGISAMNLETILSEASMATAIGVGPGMGQNSDTYAIVAALCAQKTPLVLDADALNVLANDMDVLSHHAGPVILTPHEMEMARLCGCEVSYVSQNRVAVAKNLAQKLDAVVVLKGAHTLVASKTDLFMIPTGNPGMSTAGAGDVLTGMITGFLAQNIPPIKAALLGAYLHGMCGDQAAETRGRLSLTAQDILKAIAPVLRSFE